MPILPENPCAEHHQELALMTNCTSFRDVDTMMLCNRCGDTMSFEAAVRNDERMKIAAAIENMEVDQFGSDFTILLDAAKLARRGGQEGN